MSESVCVFVRVVVVIADNITIWHNIDVEDERLRKCKAHLVVIFVWQDFELHTHSAHYVHIDLAKPPSTIIVWLCRDL